LIGYRFVLGGAEDTLTLQLVQFQDYVLVLAAEASFLELQIAKLAFINNGGFGVDQRGGGIRIKFGELFGKLDAAACEYGHFQGGDTVQTPAGIGETLDDFILAFVLRVMVAKETFDVLLICGGIVGRQQDGATGESGFDGVQRSNALARFRTGPRR
jgi:hypothetical protein